MSKVRVQADADLDEDIVRGIRRLQPAIDILTAAEGGVIGLADPEVLRICYAADRILVSHDMRTMPGHLQAHLAQGLESPGIFIVSRRRGIRAAIEEIHLIWSASEHEEWRNQLVRLPL